MKLDVAKFLQLTAALAAVGCERSRPADAPGNDGKVIVAQAPEEAAAREQPKIVPSQASSAEALAPSAEAPSPPAPMVEAPPRLSAPESPPVAQCANVSPMCESLQDSCNALNRGGDPSGEGAWGFGFTRPVAEQIATCWASKVKPPGCDEKAQKKCVRDAVMKAKVDKKLDAVCSTIIGDCKRAGKPAKWVKDQCVHILSATSGAARDEAARMMGPMGEHCTLDYVLPYAPFGR